MFGSPNNQLFWRIAPAQAERRLQDGLGVGFCGGQDRQQPADSTPFSEFPQHVSSLAKPARLRKSGSLRRGFVLIEAMLALSLLTVVGLILLKLSINILAPRQWVLQQTITDAYMTGERATAERAPFSAITGAASPWPLGATAVTPNVFLGRLPGGANITGTLTRTRSLIRDSSNDEVYPIANDADTTPAGVAAAALAKTRNPSQMQVCKLQSILTYTVGRNSYVKSRSVARSQ